MNEIERRFKPIDKYLKKYLIDYKKINKQTQDTLQAIFNELDIDYTDLNKKIPQKKKDRLDRRLDELLKKKKDNYMYYMLKQALNKKTMTYRELLETYITSAYYEERQTMDEYDNTYFYETLETSYMQGIADIRKLKPKRRLRDEIFNIPILYTILNIPLLYGTKEAYLYALAMTNAEEMYKRAINNMQGLKGLDIDSRDMQELLLKQRNRLISIQDEKYSGAIENMTESYCNLAYLQSGINNDIRQCRFIAVRDKRTTKMCKSLDNLVFNLDEMNTYQRYSDVDGKVVTYHTKGMVVGENLPPISNHFHWCRSTITYNIDENIGEFIRDNTIYTKLSDIEQYDKYVDILGKERVGTLDDFTKTKYNIDKSEWENLKAEYRRFNTVVSGARNGSRIKTIKTKQKHANMFYEEVRKRMGDSARISSHTKWTEEQIEEIRKYIFIDEHKLGDKTERFEPDYDMAVSWQRLNDGKDIQKHDLLLLDHEYYEMELIKQGYSQYDAHIIASKKYNYAKGVSDYDRSKESKN